MSRTVTKTDPNDWAKKRKEAMDRAKLKREERKFGAAEDTSENTFKPQINKRPQYLKKEDSAVSTFPDRDPNDIFEKPLPGMQGQQQFREMLTQPQPHEPILAQPLSSYAKPSHGSSNTDSRRPHQPESNYKSKFLQQYEQEHEEPYQPTPKSKAEVEVEEVFMSSLRGGEKSSGSGWNDDTSNSSIPNLPKKVSYRRRKSTEQNQNQPPNNPTRPAARQPAAAAAEWNSDFGNGIPSLPPSQQYLRRDNIQSSPSNINRGIDSAGNGGVSDVSQVRSGLSLLKSKMRKTESGGDLRSLSASEKERERQRPLHREREDQWDAAPPMDPPPNQPRGGRRQQQNAPRSSNPPFASEYDSNDYGAESHPPPQFNRRVGPARQQYASQSASQPQEDPYQRNQYQEPPRQAPKSQQQNLPPAQSAYRGGDRGDRGGGGGYSGGQGGGYQDNDNSQAGAHDPFAQRHPKEVSQSTNFDPTLEEDIGMGEQLECPDCGRKFNPAPYEKHVKICAKIFLQKRKVFDSKKMRMNEELEQFQKVEQKTKKKGGKQAGTAASAGAAKGAAGGAGGGDRPIQGERAAKWKEQSVQLREAMKMARLAKQAQETGGPMPDFVPSAPDPSLVRCPHCGRSFNERAAERHIPVCTNIKAKPSSLKKGSGGAGGKTGGPTGLSGGGGMSTASKPAPAASKPAPRRR